MSNRRPRGVANHTPGRFNSVTGLGALVALLFLGGAACHKRPTVLPVQGTVPAVPLIGQEAFGGAMPPVSTERPCPSSFCGPTTTLEIYKNKICTVDSTGKRECPPPVKSKPRGNPLKRVLSKLKKTGDHK